MLTDLASSSYIYITNYVGVVGYPYHKIKPHYIRMPIMILQYFNLMECIMNMIWTLINLLTSPLTSSLNCSDTTLLTATVIDPKDPLQLSARVIDPKESLQLSARVIDSKEPLELWLIVNANFLVNEDQLTCKQKCLYSLY